MEVAPRSRVAWAFAFTAVAVVVVLTAAGLFVFNSVRSIPGDVVDSGLAVAGRLRELASAFRQGTVETTFATYAAQLSGSNYLQVASLRQTEVFSRTDHGSVLWGQIPLPDVAVAATVPVEYTYYLDLDEEWRFRLEDGVMWVIAPAIRFNTPALDVSQLHFDVRESSLLRDEELVVDGLRAGLTQLSRDRAAGHIDLIREMARRKTRDFVGTWLVSAFSDAGRYRVEVEFDDEQSALTMETPRS